MNKSLIYFCLACFIISATLAARETAFLKIRIVNGSGESLSGNGIVQLYNPKNHKRMMGEKPVRPELIFDSLIPDTAYPYLIRILYEDISYSAVIFLKESGHYDTTLIVYNIGYKTGALTYSVPHWFVFIQPDEILFEETIEISNPEPFVIIPETDTLPGILFSLPEGSSLIGISGGHDTVSPMPLITAKNVNGVYGISYPIHPGKSRIHLRYFMQREPGTILIRRAWLQDIQFCNLLVFPATAKLSGEGWTFTDDAELKKNNYALYKSGPFQSGSAVRFELSDDSTRSPFSEIRSEDNMVQKYNFILIVIFIAGGVFLFRFIEKRSS